MATRIFDRETLLDLVVNAVPLFIMGFFIIAFVLFSPFGFDPLASLLQFGIVIASFVALLILSYFSAKAIAGAEKNGPVFLPGQTTPAVAEPLGHHGAETGEGDEDATVVDDDDEPADEADPT